MPIGEPAKYIPNLFPQDKPRKIPFAEWWTNTIATDTKNRTFNRHELIGHVADTDGGAHVDPGLEEKYLDLSRRNSLGAMTGPSAGPLTAVPEPHLPALRTIAHEVLLTLDESANWAFPRPYLYEQPEKGKSGGMIAGVALHSGKRRASPGWLATTAQDARGRGIMVQGPQLEAQRRFPARGNGREKRFQGCKQRAPRDGPRAL
jgi:hypothetical protein